MKFDPPRIVIQSDLFKKHYLELKKEKTPRIDEWIKGYEFVLPRFPNYGELIAEKEGTELRMSQNYDTKNKRSVSIYYTYDDEKVIFIDIKARHIHR